MPAAPAAALAIIAEVRRPFREIPGILEGTGKPDAALSKDASGPSLNIVIEQMAIAPLT